MTPHSPISDNAQTTPFGGRGVWRLAWFLTMVAVTSPCSAAEEDVEGEMAKITAAHKHWRESIVSVRFVWDTVWDPHSKLAKDSGFDGVKQTGRGEFIWCDDGRFRIHSVGRHNDGPELGRSLHCGHGQRSYSVNYVTGPSEIDKPTSIIVQPALTPGQGGGLVLTPLEGLWFSHRLFWLSDLISQKLVSFDGYADVMGEKLPRVKVEYAPGSHLRQIVLNPQHGYLPRRIGDGVRGYEFHTYREIEPNLWFPWTGAVIGTVDPQTWEMKEIQVNSELAPKLFEPPPPVQGTIIVDLMSGKQTVHGTTPRSSEVEQRIVQNAKNNLALAGEPVTATPPTSGTMGWTLMFSFVSLVLVAATVFLKRRRNLVVLLFMMGGVTSPCTAEEDPEGEMAKITAAHKHWRESIVSVRFVWETVHDPHSKLLKDSGLDGLKRSARDEFIWCDDGRFRINHVVQHNGGPEILRSLHVADGKRYCNVLYGVGPSQIDKPVSINILPVPTPGQGGGMLQVPLEGLWFSHRLYWLSDLISQGLVKFDGYADVMGERLPRVKVEYARGGSFMPIVLNPQKGYLPRLIELGSARSEFLSYRLIEPNLWFPWTGSRSAGTLDSETWEMKEIQVNSHLNPKLFEPPLAPGTVVEDIVTGKRTVHGATSQHSEVERRIAQNAKNNLAPAGEPVTALPPSSGAMRWIVIGSVVSLVLAAAAVFLRRRG